MGRRHLLPFLVSVVALAATASPAHGSKTQFTIFDASEELTGSLCCSALTEPALDDARGLGADTVRLLVYWRDIAAAPDSTTKPAGNAGDPAWPGYAQPTAANRGGGWGRYDQLVREITARGMSVAMVPTGRFPDGRVPRWASNSPIRDGTDPDPSEYGLFLKALGNRYRGGYDPDGPGGSLTAIPPVSFVGVWNEPNSPYQLQPQVKGGAPYTPGLYRRLFSAGSAGLRQGGFRGQIWMGELAPRGTRTTLGALAFTRRFLCLSPAKRKKDKGMRSSRRGNRIVEAGCPILRADAFAHHPHSGVDVPFRAPFGRDDVTIGNVPALGRLLSQAAKAGAINPMPIVLSEYGVQTNPPDTLFGLSFQQQAEYIGIAEYLAYRNPKVSAWSQYLLRDDAASGGFQSGLRLRDGTLKPSFGAFRTPLVIRKARGKRPKRAIAWGEVRPAGGVHVQIQRSIGNNWRPATPVFKTDGRGYFQRKVSYSRGRQFRLVWFDARDGFGNCSGDCVGPAIRAYAFK